MMRWLTKPLFKSCTYAALSYGMSIYKLSWVIGSKALFLSGGNFFNPLIGVFGGASASLFVFVIKIISRVAVFGIKQHVFLFNIPTLAASLYFLATPFSPHLNVQKAYQIGLTILLGLCVILFMLHPQGWLAASYTMLWLIPLLILWLPYQSFFLSALGSTFTAHAVGAVLWIWQQPLSAEYWLGMIPVVFAERCTFAIGMTLLYYLITIVRSRMVFYANVTRNRVHA